MKYHPSGITSIGIDRNRNDGKPRGNPGRTENFVEEIENENFEGKEPSELDSKIWTYKNITYTINRDGIIKSKKGEDEKEIKPQIISGKCYVTLRSYDGKSIKLKKMSVLSLMEKIFGKYFLGHSKKSKKPSKYKLVPKDGDYTNLKYNNLEYVDIYKYTKIGIVRTLIEWGIKDEVIIKGCKITNKKLREIKKNMQKEGYEDFIEKTGIKFSLEDYIKIAYEGKHLSDKELSEETELKEKDIKIIRRRLKYEYFIKKTGIKISFGVYIMIAYEGKDSKDKELSKKTRIKLKDIKIIRHRLKKLEDENL